VDRQDAMMHALASILLSVFSWTATQIIRPRTADCASGFAPDGVRPNGITTCIQVIRDDSPSCAGSVYCESKSPPKLSYYLRVFCPRDRIAYIGLHGTRIRCQKVVRSDES
jgi:hypothetical protein